MKVGSIVECIYPVNSWDAGCENLPDPVVGSYYTIDWVGYGGRYIGLEELSPESAFAAHKFREMQPPLDITALIKECKTETV